MIILETRIMFMALACRFRRTCCKFGRDVTGAILPIFALMAVLMLVIAGSGIDYARAVNSREVMANALDAAALAVASQLSTSVMSDDEIEEMLEEVFEANLSSLTLKTLAVTNLEFDIDSNEGTVEVSSTIAVPTYFIGIGGIGPEHLDVSVNTVVNYSKFDVELALVLDVTGSMDVDPKDFEAMQTAAMSLVDTLIPEGTSSDDSKVRISIVPYSQGVNAGSYADAVTNGEMQSRNCVTERTGDEQFTDAAYDYDDEDSEFFGGGSDSEFDKDKDELNISSRGNCSSASKLIALTSNRSILEGAITSLTAAGGTAGQVGIAWGWYTLSPNWSNLWPSESEPADYDDEDVLKFAVLMTDGVFNRFYYKYQVEETIPAEEECTGEWVYSNNRRGNRNRYWEETCVVIKESYKIMTDEYWLEDDLEDGYYGTPAKRARSFCDEMKKENITIFSIFFETPSSSNSDKDVMEYCADNEDSFYYASSPENLIIAFGNIAKKVQSIYLAK